MQDQSEWSEKMDNDVHLRETATNPSGKTKDSMPPSSCKPVPGHAVLDYGFSNSVQVHTLKQGQLPVMIRGRPGKRGGPTAFRTRRVLSLLPLRVPV
jgi:hypothetical protein